MGKPKFDRAELERDIETELDNPWEGLTERIAAALKLTLAVLDAATNGCCWLCYDERFPEDKDCADDCPVAACLEAGLGK